MLLYQLSLLVLTSPSPSLSCSCKHCLTCSPGLGDPPRFPKSASSLTRNPTMDGQGNRAPSPGCQGSSAGSNPSVAPASVPLPPSGGRDAAELQTQQTQRTAQGDSLCAPTEPVTVPVVPKGHNGDEQTNRLALSESLPAKRLIWCNSD